MTRRLAPPLATLAMILAALAAAPAVLGGGGCHGSDAVPSDAGASVVRMDGCTFLPTVNRVPVGVQITFLNATQTYHDVTGRTGEWGSRTLEAGQSYTTTFTDPGIYPYSCSLHPGMAGVIVAGAVDQAGAAAQPLADVAVATSREEVPPAGFAVELVLAAAAGLMSGSLATGVLVGARRSQA